MVICIEYWKGDTFLQGPKREICDLQKQILEIENLYDVNEDNFIPLLCRVFNWEKIRESENMVPDYTYDRDTGQSF